MKSFIVFCVINYCLIHFGNDRLPMMITELFLICLVYLYFVIFFLFIEELVSHL